MPKQKKMVKLGKFDVYLEETSPKNAPEKIEWHVTAHDPATTTTENLGYHATEEAALTAAKKFCLD